MRFRTLLRLGLVPVAMASLPCFAQQRPIVLESGPIDAPLPPLNIPGTVTPQAIIRRGIYTSYQVNVNAQQQNIVGDAANEPSLAIDPRDPNKIAIGWRQFDSIGSNFRQAGYAFTVDAGVTWTFPGKLTPGVFRSDPVLESNADGVFYYHSLKENFLCDLFTSSNQGQTWGSAVAAFGGDKAWMTVDKTSGPGRNFIHASWSPNAGCCSNRIYTRSINGGASWLNPITLPLTPMFGTLDYGPDGELYICGIENNSFGSFVCIKSTNANNGSQTPTFPLQRRPNLNGSMRIGTGVNPDGLLGQAWVAVDRSNGPRRGWVYMLCSVDPPGSDPLDVNFVRSTDGGNTWSTWQKINTDPPLSSSWQWFGTLGVAPNGRIDVVWYDTRNSSNARLSELYYRSSHDGGTTWSPEIPISPQFDRALGYPQQNKLGDYIDIESDRMGCSVTYAATFNGEQDVYYVRIPVVRPVTGVRPE